MSGGLTPSKPKKGRFGTKAHKKKESVKQKTYVSEFAFSRQNTEQMFGKYI